MTELDSRIPLAQYPTPLEPLDRLSEHLGGRARVWVKRDDFSSLGAGGNKTRKLEFLLADAQEHDSDVVITCGGLQSNHARLTAAACARLGLACELFLGRVVEPPGPSYERSGNMLLDRLFGAQVRLCPEGEDAALAAERRESELRGQRLRPYLIPLGGSNEIGCRGYVHCAAELLEQANEASLSFDDVFVAVGSGGTAAGLAVGLARQGWAGVVRGVSVSESHEAALATVRGLVQRISPDAVEVSLTVDDRFLGGGYGSPTEEARAAIATVARLEGLLLDPVYTGKTMAALIEAVSAGRVEGDVVFLHTGGMPALFAYLEVM